MYGQYYVPSAAIRAMEEGRTLIVEELDRCGRDTLFPVFFDMIEYHTTYVPALQQERRAAEGFNCILTVNRETDTGTVRLPDALLRRCRRVFIPMPDPATEARIVLANLPDAPERLVQRAVAAVQKVRQMEVEHKPVPSETVQWVMDVIGMFGAGAEGTPDQLALTLPAVCKNAEDESDFRSALSSAASASSPQGARGLFSRGDAGHVRR
jgi:MoxR-like ATPase